MLIAFTVLLVLFLGLLRPSYGWDMIAYVAASYQQDGYKGSELSNKTYSAVKAEVSNEVFSELTKGNYKNRVYADPIALDQQIPMYSIKVVYVELMRCIHKVGIGYPKCSRLISACFAALSVIILARLIAKTQLPMILLPIIVGLAGYILLAKLPTPDSISCFFSAWAILSLATKSKSNFVICVILPFMRPDDILLSVLMMGFKFFEGSKWSSLISLFISLIGYECINKFAGNYGWLNLFNFSFINIYTPYPANLVPSGRLDDYVRPYIAGVETLITERFFIIYALALCLLWIFKTKIRFDRKFWILFVIPLSFAAMHFVLFPDCEGRYFVFSTSIICVWLFSFIKRVRETAPQSG